MSNPLHRQKGAERGQGKYERNERSGYDLYQYGDDVYFCAFLRAGGVGADSRSQMVSGDGGRVCHGFGV